MKHYDLTIISPKEDASKLLEKFQDYCSILLIDKHSKIQYRNTIKQPKGYILILRQAQKNVEIFTKTLVILR